jgi:hypothetical protein
MKLMSFALTAALACPGFVYAQTSAQAPATAPASSSEASQSLGKACKKEVKDLCGHAHGQEMKDCVKAGMDMNKFSADCKAKLAAKAAAKPTS